MFDAKVRRWIDPPLQWLSARLARHISADVVTIAACVMGMGAALAAATGAFATGLTLFLFGRLLDGLDGAIARHRGKTDRGGFLDIVLDFAVYAAVPLAFAVHDPSANALAAAGLLAGIVFNGSAFLAYAVMAERRGAHTSAQGEKSLFYLAGLAEGAETVIAYTLCFLLPAAFPVVATAFALLCAVSGIARVVLAWRTLR
jgi:phosphatidylglycerophosphate synthase